MSITLKYDAATNSTPAPLLLSQLKAGMFVIGNRDESRYPLEKRAVYLVFKNPGIKFVSLRTGEVKTPEGVGFWKVELTKPITWAKKK